MVAFKKKKKNILAAFLRLSSTLQHVQSPQHAFSQVDVCIHHHPPVHTEHFSLSEKVASYAALTKFSFSHCL